MVRYLRKCRRSEKAGTMEKAAETKKMEAGRKRKLVLGEYEISASSAQFKSSRLPELMPGNSASPVSAGTSTCESVSSGHGLASCCSSSRLSELAESSNFVDLEQEDEVTVEFFATSAGHSMKFRDRKEKAPSSEAQAESGELESTARPHDSNCRCSTAQKTPSEAEVEEFFTAAEENLQTRFLDKYNYDIVKDEPMEGRYQWVQIQLKRQ